jgi:hypothetical protein
MLGKRSLVVVALLLAACSSSNNGSSATSATIPRTGPIAGGVTVTSGAPVRNGTGSLTCAAAAAIREHRAMPRPERVTAQAVVLRDGGRVDPIGATFHPRIRAARAWDNQVTRPGATYRVILGYYTDRPAVTDAAGQPMHPAVRRVAAWLAIAHRVPFFVPPGPPNGRAGSAASSPRCEFGDTLFALDATTGRFLGSGTL